MQRLYDKPSDGDASTSTKAMVPLLLQAQVVNEHDGEDREHDARRIREPRIRFVEQHLVDVIARHENQRDPLQPLAASRGHLHQKCASGAGTKFD